jgi:hypothetical protein
MSKIGVYEITEEAFNYSLGSVPPREYIGGEGWSTFKLGEDFNGNLVDMYCRNDDKYYHLRDDKSLSHEEIVRMVKKYKIHPKYPTRTAKAVVGGINFYLFLGGQVDDSDDPGFWQDDERGGRNIFVKVSFFMEDELVEVFPMGVPPKESVDGDTTLRSAIIGATVVGNREHAASAWFEDLVVYDHLDFGVWSVDEEVNENE